MEKGEARASESLDLACRGQGDGGGAASGTHVNDDDRPTGTKAGRAVACSVFLNLDPDDDSPKICEFFYDLTIKFLLVPVVAGARSSGRPPCINPRRTKGNPASHWSALHPSAPQRQRLLRLPANAVDMGQSLFIIASSPTSGPGYHGFTAGRPYWQPQGGRATAATVVSKLCVSCVPHRTRHSEVCGLSILFVCVFGWRAALPAVDPTDSPRGPAGWGRSILQVSTTGPGPLGAAPSSELSHPTPPKSPVVPVATEGFLLLVC